MAKGWYIGDSNYKARKVKKIYIGGADGKARKVKKVYIGDANGKARLCYRSGFGVLLFSTSSNTNVYTATNYGTPSKITIPNSTVSYSYGTQCAFANGRYGIAYSVINSSNKNSVFYSLDGCDTWTAVPMGTTGATYSGMKFRRSGDLFVLIQGYGTSIAISSDLATYKSYKVNTSTYGFVDGICNENGSEIMGVTSNYICYYSKDSGATWSAVFGMSNPQRVAYGNGCFIGYSQNQGFYKFNTNTLRWESVSNIYKGSDINRLAFVNGYFVASVSSSAVLYYTSDNGATWNAFTPPRRLPQLEHDGDKYIGMSSDGIYGYSNDMLSGWTYVGGLETFSNQVCGG